MKKLLFLLAMLPMMLFTACSDDDDENISGNESELIGVWVEDTDYTYEVLHVQFNSDHTGASWATDNGVIDEWGKDSFTWSVSGNHITTTYSDGDSDTVTFSVNGDKLTVYGEETIVYKKQ